MATSSVRQADSIIVLVLGNFCDFQGGEQMSISSSAPMAELSDWVLPSRGTESRQGCRSLVGPVGVGGTLQPSSLLLCLLPASFFPGADCYLCKHLTRLADSRKI